MRPFQCRACGSDAPVVRDSYEFGESGLERVVLQGIDIVRCEHCGNEDPIIPRVNDMMRCLALAVIGKPYRLAGREVRFLRKYLRMTGDEFCRLVPVDRTTLSKWENDDDPVGEPSDRLIRMIALTLGEDLKEKTEEMVRSFPEIKDVRRSVRIDMDPATMSYRYAP